MPTLHTINKPSLQGPALTLCLRFAAPGDRIVLIEDGVCAAIEGSDACAILNKAEVASISALSTDLADRGLLGRQAADIEIIDYNAFVALCCEHDKVQSWF